MYKELVTNLDEKRNRLLRSIHCASYHTRDLARDLICGYSERDTFLVEMGWEKVQNVMIHFIKISTMLP